MLGVRHVPFSGSGGEAGIAREVFAELADLVPGVQGAIWDMAFTGTIIDWLMRELGWLTVTRVPAKERHARRGQRGGRRVERTALVEIQDLTLLDGTSVKVSLYARAGALGIRRLDDWGDHVFVPLEPIQILRRGRKGRFRFYGVYRLPAEYDGIDITIRLHTNEQDAKRKFNRAHNLRAFPPSSPDFDRLYGRRNDAESINRQLEDSLFLKKAHSVGHLRQESDLMGFMLMVNALTRARFQEARLRVAA